MGSRFDNHHRLRDLGTEPTLREQIDEYYYDSVQIYFGKDDFTITLDVYLEVNVISKSWRIYDVKISGKSLISTEQFPLKALATLLRGDIDDCVVGAIPICLIK